ncbi:hypothetical protein RLT85_05760 [Mesonia ostreae]|uniref:Secretion system C-terminal sorting domain-containing protein n=2 Tax=Mesonia ostreae TaxID=861110 RepID=A0ABU2KHG6_9FLAO|nr:hypothetical protein [Mesonia ostreae]MDT0294134.1 hypothetical protein [Mesonia ostreae]
MFQKIALFVFLLLSSLSFSQQFTFISRGWDLQKVTVDGVDYMATPLESEAFNIYNSHGTSPTYTSFISTLDPEIFLKAKIIFTGNDTFFFFSLGYWNQNRPQVHASKSSDLTSEYPVKFYYDYYNNNSSYPTFSYSVTHISGNDYQLIIEKENGDQAHYISQSLAINSFTKNNFSLFPNPVHHSFQVKADANITAITLFDVNGKEVKKFNSAQQNY